MKVIVNNFQDDSTIFIYPCLLQHINCEGHNGVILATRTDCDFFDGVVLTLGQEHRGLGIGQYVERFFLKKDYKPFYGEVILANG